MTKGLCMLGGGLLLLGVLLGECGAEDIDIAINPVPRLEIHSPERTFTFASSPSRRDGKGPSDCRLLKGTETAWERVLPFTLCGAVLDDGGCIAGFGYSHGPECYAEPGNIQLILIDSEGRVARIDKLPRSQSRHFHDLPYPMAKEIVHDIEGRRALFRVSSIRGDDRDEERWMTYSMESFQPTASVDVKICDWIVALRSVPGTRFFMAQHWSFRTGSSGSMGAVYKLYDQEGNVSWTLDKSGDFDSGESDIPDDRLRRFQTQTMISSAGISKRINIQFVQEAERVSFEASDDGLMREVGRVGSPSAIESPESAIELDPKRFKALQESRRIELGQSVDNRSRPIRNVEAYDLDARDRIGFVREETDGPDTFVVVTLEGRVVSELKLDVEELPKARWKGVAAVGEGNFVVFQSQIGIGAKSRAWRVDPTTQTVSLLKAFESPSIECVSGFPDGSFVVLSNDHLRYTITESVAGYDSNGHVRWRKESDSSDALGSFLSPESVAVSSNGLVMVLDNVKKRVCVFDSHGVFQSAHVLEKLWRRPPNYLRHITRRPGGGYCLFDFQGKPSLILSNESGQIVESMTCKRDGDSHDFQPHGGPRVSSKGEIWFTDGESFFSVGKNGIASLRFPETPTETLATVAWIAVQRDRIFVQSKTTGAVHVFDLDGEPVMVLSDRRLISAVDSLQPIQVLPNRDVMVRHGELDYSKSRWLLFSSTGQRLREEEFNSRNVHPVSQTRFIENNHDRLRLVEEDGTILKRVDRQPNGDWLGSGLGVSVSDAGAFAVPSRGVDRNGRWATNICLYSADGEPIGIFPVGSIHLDNLDFDGSRIAITNDKNAYVFASNGEPLYRVEWADEKNRECWLIPKLIPERSSLMLVECNDGNRDIRLFTISE